MKYSGLKRISRWLWPVVVVSLAIFVGNTMYSSVIHSVEYHKTGMRSSLATLRTSGSDPAERGANLLMDLSLISTADQTWIAKRCARQRPEFIGSEVQFSAYEDLPLMPHAQTVILQVEGKALWIKSIHWSTGLIVEFERPPDSYLLTPGSEYHLSGILMPSLKHLLGSGFSNRGSGTKNICAGPTPDASCNAAVADVFVSYFDDGTVYGCGVER